MMENLDTEIINWVLVAKGDVPGHAFHGNQWVQSAAEKVRSLHDKLSKIVNSEGLPKGLHFAAQVAQQISGTHTALSNHHSSLGNADKAEQHSKAATAYGTAAKLLETASDYLGARNAVSHAGQLSESAFGNTRKSVGEIQKGDVPGHPFRGNQYAQVAADHADEHRETAAMHMDKANELARSAGAHLQFDGDAQLAQSTLDKANAHEAAANAHEAAAKAWDGVRQSGDTASANAAQALSTKAYEATGSIQKSVGEIQKSDDFPDARIPTNLNTTNDFSTASQELMDNARAIIAVHEGVAMDGLKPLESDDYSQLADAHDELAKYHQAVALALKVAEPVLYIQAISAHGDAMGAHEDAAKTTRMMMDTTYDPHWDGHHGEMRHAWWNTQQKVWRKAHRAFLMSQQAFNRTNFATGIAKSEVKVQKGDVPGHIFHGNQYVSGTSAIPSDVGHRDFDPKTTLAQIGRMNVLGVSGGKVNTIHDTSGKAVGVELPVSSGYRVRVFLRDDDTYTVQRVLSRAGKETVKGQETGIYAPQVGEQVYQAGMYKSNPFGGHKP